MKVCNLCGKEFDDAADMNVHTAENGTEYYICGECEEKGVNVSDTKNYYICKNCGFVHYEDEYSGLCKFCGHANEAQKVGLTEVEEQLIDSDPEKLYEEKLGAEAAEKISAWKISGEQKEVEIRHTRDRKIDTVFVAAIIIGYFMLDFAIRKFVNNKALFTALLAPTLIEIISAPVFKAIDRKPRKKPLPIWSIFAVMAACLAIYFLILNFGV